MHTPAEVWSVSDSWLSCLRHSAGCAVGLRVCCVLRQVRLHVTQRLIASATAAHCVTEHADSCWHADGSTDRLSVTAAFAWNLLFHACSDISDVNDRSHPINRTAFATFRILNKWLDQFYNTKNDRKWHGRGKKAIARNANFE